MFRLRQSIERKILRFNEAIASAKSENVALELLRDKKRFLALNDLYWLCCYVGNDEIAKYPDYYKPFCDEVSLLNWKIVRLKMHKPGKWLLPVDDVTDNPDEDLSFLQRLYLCYRTYYKTTIISKVHSLQLILNFPNIHILIAHNKQNSASANLVSVKNYFLTTGIRTLFSRYIPNTKDWGSMSGFSVANRTDWGRDEQTIMAVGVDTEITGGHWQMVKKNDLVTEDSVNTEEQRKKTINWDNIFNLGHFDDPQVTLQDYEGTRYHFTDLYSVKLGDPKIKLIDIPLLKDKNADNITEENISNPGRFTVNGVRELKRDIWYFNCQLLLKPDDPARMQFKPEMIQYFTSIPQGSNFYLVVDPASRRKKKSDWTVMLIVALGWFDGRLRRFICDGIRDKIDPKQRVDRAIELAKKWKIKGCGWEAVGFQETDCFYLEEKRRELRMFFTIEEVKSHTAAKEDNIRGLIPEYAQLNWLWPQKGKIVNLNSEGRSYCLTECMEQEMLQFPMCEHDDLLDAMTFINRIVTIKPQEPLKVIESTEMTFGEYAKIRDDRLNWNRKHPWENLSVGRR